MEIPLKRRSEAKIIDDAWLNFADDRAQVLAQLQDDIGPFLARLRPVGRGLFLRKGQGQLQGEQGQLLADVVVNTAGQPLVLLLIKQLLPCQKLSILME